MNLFDHLRHPDPSASGPTPRGSASRRREVEMAQCDEVEADLTAYFDGEACDASALRARRHLDACPACAKMWRDWGDARLALKTSRVPDVPASWPASLVQRARLQTLLPALFASAPSSLAHQNDPSINTDRDASEAEVPPGLQRAILARTTRARSISHSSELDDAWHQTRVVNTPTSRRLSWPVASACVPALAAWMLVMTAPLAPRLPLPPVPPTLAVSNMLGALALPEAPRPSAAPVASPRQSQTLSASEREVGVAPPKTRSAPTHQTRSQVLPLRAPVRPVRSSGPVAAEPGESAQQRKPVEVEEVLQPRRAAPRDASDSNFRPAHMSDLEKRPKPYASPSPSASPEQSPAPVADREANTPSTFRQAKRIAAAPRAVVKPQVSMARVAAEPAAPAREARAVEHLEVAAEVSDLNDARPDEISEAVDAYAATWVEDEEPLQ